MQPDPQLFLPALRRELLYWARGDVDRSSPLCTMSLTRMAETISHLAASGEVSETMAQCLPAQRVLLTEMHSAILAANLELAQGERVLLERALSICDGNELDSASYAFLVRAQSALLHRLSVNNVAALDRLIHNACHMERQIYVARDEAVARAQSAALSSGPNVDEAVTDSDLTDYLRQRFPDSPMIFAANVSRHKGINTKEIFFLEIHGKENWPRDVVLRRNRAFDMVGNIVSDEFAVMQELSNAGVALPKPLFADEMPILLKRPLLVMERLQGRAESVASLGTSGPTVLRGLAHALGVLHGVDTSRLKFPRRIYGTGACQRTRKLLDRLKEMAGDMSDQSWVTAECAYEWLSANAQCLSETVSMVHGDCDLRNVLVYEGRFSSLIDWELAHEGNPAEDLGYLQPSVEQAMDWDEFMDVYHSAGGPIVTDEEMRYFRLFGYYFSLCCISAVSHSFSKRLHNDFIIGAASFLEHSVYLRGLNELLAKATTTITA